MVRLVCDALCTRRHCAVAPAGDAANTIAAPNISAEPNHAADFSLTIAHLHLPYSTAGVFSSVFPFAMLKEGV